MKIFSNLNNKNHKNLVTIFLAGIFFWSSIFSLLPTLPIYIGTLTQSFEQIGIIMGSFSVGTIVFRSYCGKLSDRKGRGYMMQLGLVVAMIIPLSYALSNYIPLLIFLRVVHGISIAAYDSSYNALVSDIAPVEKRGEVIGYMSLVQPIGFVFGPTIGGLTYQFLGYQLLFVSASLLALVGYLLIFQIRSKINENNIQEPVSIKKPARSGFWQTILSARVITPALVLLSLGCGFGTLTAFMPILMQQKHISINAGTYYTIAALSGFMVRFFVGRVSNQWGRGIFISIGICFYALSMAIIYFASYDYEFVLSGIVEGFGSGLVFPGTVALLADRTFIQERGYIIGIAWIGFDLGIAISGPLMGMLISLVGITNIFAIATGVCLLGLVAFATQSNKSISDSLKFAVGKTGDRFAT